VAAVGRRARRGGYVVPGNPRTRTAACLGSIPSASARTVPRPAWKTRANTFTAREQANPAVVGLAGGGYVVTWDSNGQDGSGLGVYLQRYDAGGVPAEARRG